MSKDFSIEVTCQEENVGKVEEYANNVIKQVSESSCVVNGQKISITGLEDQKLANGIAHAIMATCSDAEVTVNGVRVKNGK